MKRGIKEMNIILASGSPRRKELLAQAGFDFEVEVSNADENVAEESPTEMVEELAARKAEAVVNLHNKKEDNCLVIGADTIVVLDGKILGKPSDEADARLFIRSDTSGVYRSSVVFSKRRYHRKKDNLPRMYRCDNGFHDRKRNRRLCSIWRSDG